MPTTSPYPIWYPDDTSPVAPLENLFSTLAASVNTQLGLLDAKYGGNDMPWTALAPAAGWSANTGGGAPMVRRDGNIVTYKGGFFGGTAGSTATTVPSWARPARTVTIPAVHTGSTTFSVVQIDTAGTFQPVTTGVSGTSQLQWNVL